MKGSVTVSWCTMRCSCLVRVLGTLHDKSEILLSSHLLAHFPVCTICLCRVQFSVGHNSVHEDHTDVVVQLQRTRDPLIDTRMRVKLSTTCAPLCSSDIKLLCRVDDISTP